jgi:hypothetical protein
MFVYNDAVPAQLIGALYFIEIAIVKLVAFDGIVDGVGKRDPGRIVFLVKIGG